MAEFDDMPRNLRDIANEHGLLVARELSVQVQSEAFFSEVFG